MDNPSCERLAERARPSLNWYIFLGRSAVLPFTFDHPVQATQLLSQALV